MILIMTPKVQEVIYQCQGAPIWGGSTQIEVEEAHSMMMITQDMARTVILRCFHHQDDADLWILTALYK